MMNLPYGTHRYLIEPLSGVKHVKKVLVNRFLSFMEKISVSAKKAVKMLMETSKKYLRSVTGQNFREIMLLVGKTSVEAVTRGDGDMIDYFPIAETDCWKMDIIKEITDAKNKVLDIDHF